MNRPIGLGLRTELATAAMALVTVLTFHRVFAGWSFLPELVGAALLPLLG